jgi:hypothetical protein
MARILGQLKRGRPKSAVRLWVEQTVGSLKLSTADVPTKIVVGKVGKVEDLLQLEDGSLPMLPNEAKVCPIELTRHGGSNGRPLTPGAANEVARLGRGDHEASFTILRFKDAEGNEVPVIVMSKSAPKVKVPARPAKSEVTAKVTRKKSTTTRKVGAKK